MFRVSSAAAISASLARRQLVAYARSALNGASCWRHRLALSSRIALGIVSWRIVMAA